MANGEPWCPTCHRMMCEGHGTFLGPNVAWEYVGSDGIKRCPNCGATELEGMEVCSECGRGPFEDRRWRAVGGKGEARGGDKEDQVSVSETKAFRVARDAYLKGCEDTRRGDGSRDYEDRVRAAEDVARVLMRILTAGD